MSVFIIVTFITIASINYKPAAVYISSEFTALGPADFQSRFSVYFFFHLTSIGLIGDFNVLHNNREVLLHVKRERVRVEKD